MLSIVMNGEKEPMWLTRVNPHSLRDIQPNLGDRDSRLLTQLSIKSDIVLKTPDAIRQRQFCLSNCLLG